MTTTAVTATRQLISSDMLTMIVDHLLHSVFCCCLSCEACPFVVLSLDLLAIHPHIADGVITGNQYSVHPAVSAVHFQVQRAQKLACCIDI